MSDAARVLDNAQVRHKRSVSAGRKRTKDSVRHGKANARIKRKVRKRGGSRVALKPHNKLWDDSEMSLHLCDSVRARLLELDNIDWEARYGK